MILELDNIIRSVADIQRAALSVESWLISDAERKIKDELVSLAEKIRRRAKALEIEIIEKRVAIDGKKKS